MGVILAKNPEAAQVEAVIGVQVRQRDRVDRLQRTESLQSAQRTAAQVEQHPESASFVRRFDEIARSR
jgi:hypothetical protein